jgi:hypothetical protein
MARKAPGTAFDDDNYQQTMLKLAAGFFGSQNFGDGLANAAGTIAQTNDALKRSSQPQLGGPDDAFEVYTDPQTGERSYKPVEAFQGYLQGKRTKPKDVADMNGRVMDAILQLKPEEQEAAYTHVLSNPDIYGVDPETLPKAWNPTYGRILGNMGMTVSQALTRRQAATNAQNTDRHREAAGVDRGRQLDLAEERAATQAAQGAERLRLAREALDLRTRGGTGKASKGHVAGMSNADLLSLIGAN